MFLLRGVSPLEYIIGIIGLVAAIVFFKAYIIKRNKTVRIVNKLKEINNELWWNFQTNRAYRVFYSTASLYAAWVFIGKIWWFF